MTSGIIEYAARERVKLRVDGDALVVSCPRSLTPSNLAERMSWGRTPS